MVFFLLMYLIFEELELRTENTVFYVLRYISFVHLPNILPFSPGGGGRFWAFCTALLHTPCLNLDLDHRRGRRRRHSAAGCPGLPPPQSARLSDTAGGRFQTPPPLVPAGSNVNRYLMTHDSDLLHAGDDKDPLIGQNAVQFFNLHCKIRNCPWCNFLEQECKVFFFSSRRINVVSV